MPAYLKRVTADAQAAPCLWLPTGTQHLERSCRGQKVTTVLAFNEFSAVSPSSGRLDGHAGGMMPSGWR